MKKIARLAALAVVLAASSAWAIPPHVPTYCGDPCSPNGAETGCVYWRPDGVIARGICTCINGHWAC